MYKGQLKGFPSEIVEKMLDHQVEQGNPRNVAVFEETKNSTSSYFGFDWATSNEGYRFWDNIINNLDFNHFFDLYPKKEREVIGYVLKQEFDHLNEVCQKITGFNYNFVYGFDDKNECFIVSTCHPLSKIPTTCYIKLTEAKVLDLWFEPVYKKTKRKKNRNQIQHFLNLSWKKFNFKLLTY